MAGLRLTDSLNPLYNACKWYWRAEARSVGLLPGQQCRQAVDSSSLQSRRL